MSLNRWLLALAFGIAGASSFVFVIGWWSMLFYLPFLASAALLWHDTRRVRKASRERIARMQEDLDREQKDFRA